MAVDSKNAVAALALLLVTAVCAGSARDAPAAGPAPASSVASLAAPVRSEAPSRVLTVTRLGSGSGTVTSNPSGITCGADCSESYATTTPVTLNAVADGGSKFTGWLGACTGTGMCNLNVAGDTAVSATFGPASFSPLHIDVEANHAYDALTDGLIILRYLFGLTGTTMTNGALGTGATLTDPSQLLAHLNDLKPALDVDGNGQSDALTDGLMIIRYLFGLRDNALIAGAVGTNATRTTAPVIEPYIQSLMPIPVPGTGAPMTAPEHTWTFVPFPDADCDDGSTTGLGVNLSSTSNGVLIFLNGGGACWSELTCYTLNTATHGPFGATEFAAVASSLLGGGNAASIFNRSDASNPFKDYSYVFVPYCTGDWHAGNNTVQYGANTYRHHGYANMTAYLNRIVPTFPSAGPVFLAGVSSGGFGAVFNLAQAQQRFGATRVDVIDDSGTLMPPDIVDPAGAAEQARRTSWNLAATLPAGCTACATSLDTIFGYYKSALPNNRLALLSHSPDSVLPSYYGITAGSFQTGLGELISSQIAPNPNFRSFVVGTSGHTFLGATTLSATSGGVTLGTFITQMVTNDAAWASHP